MSTRKMRGAGLSRAKVRAIKDIASARRRARSLARAALRMTDEELVIKLTRREGGTVDGRDAAHRHARREDILPSTISESGRGFASPMGCESTPDPGRPPHGSGGDRIGRRPLVPVARGDRAKRVAVAKR